MIIDSTTFPYDAVAYDRRGERIGLLLNADTDAMEGEQLWYFDPGPPPVRKTRKVKIWVLTWNGMRFERKKNTRRRVGKVLNTGQKTP